MALDLFRREGGLTDFSRDLIPLRTMMDRLFESAFTPSSGFGWSGGAGFGWDVYEDDEAFYIHCYLPGLDPDAVNVTVQDNVLSVSGETKRDVPQNWRPVLQELGYGQFRRQLALGTPVEAGQAEADYRDGILKIRLPKAEAARPKQIKVGLGGRTGVIEAGR